MRKGPVFNSKEFKVSKEFCVSIYVIDDALIAVLLHLNTFLDGFLWIEKEQELTIHERWPFASFCCTMLYSLFRWRYQRLEVTVD